MVNWSSLFSCEKKECSGSLLILKELHEEEEEVKNI